MHGLRGPEVEGQVLDAVRAAVVKVHARGHLGPRAAGQRPGPDRASRAARPRHAESSADGTRGPREARPPPRAAPWNYISRRALRRPAPALPGSAAHFRAQPRTSGRRRLHSWASLGWTLPTGLRGELMVVSPEMFSAGRGTPHPRLQSTWTRQQPRTARMSPARLPACPARVALSRLSAAPGIPDGRVPGSQRPPWSPPPSPSC